MSTEGDTKLQLKLSAALAGLTPPQTDDSKKTDEEEQATKGRTGGEAVIDPCLRALCFAAEKGNVRFGITLQVNGQLVTGILTSRERYFNETHAKFMEVPASLEADQIEAWQSWADSIFPKDYERDEDFTEVSVKEIHLADARILDRGNFIPSEGSGFTWRSPLSNISGFFIGSVVQSSGETEKIDEDV